MSYCNSGSPLILKTDKDDLYFFIDGYDDAFTDPPLSILVEHLNSELMDSSKPISEVTKIFAIGNENELSEDEAAELMDGFIGETTTHYKTSTHDLSYIERNVECGASGATEIVVLALLSGTVGGVASTITTKLLEMYGKTQTTLSTDEIHELIHSLLKENYNAKGAIICVSAKKNGIERKYTFEDENMTKYYVQFIDNEGVKSIRVKRT